MITKRSDIESATFEFAVLMSTEPALEARPIRSATFRPTKIIKTKTSLHPKEALVIYARAWHGADTLSSPVWADSDKGLQVPD